MSRACLIITVMKLTFAFLYARSARTSGGARLERARAGNGAGAPATAVARRAVDGGRRTAVPCSHSAGLPFSVAFLSFFSCFSLTRVSFPTFPLFAYCG